MSLHVLVGIHYAIDLNKTPWTTGDFPDGDGLLSVLPHFVLPHVYTQVKQEVMEGHNTVP